MIAHPEEIDDRNEAELRRRRQERARARARKHVSTGLALIDLGSNKHVRRGKLAGDIFRGCFFPGGNYPSSDVWPGRVS